MRSAADLSFRPGIRITRRAANLPRPFAPLRSAPVGRVQNKVALVTAASAGIGRATAKLFAALHRGSSANRCSHRRSVPGGKASLSRSRYTSGTCRSTRPPATCTPSSPLITRVGICPSDAVRIGSAAGCRGAGTRGAGGDQHHGAVRLREPRGRPTPFSSRVWTISAKEPQVRRLKTWTSCSASRAAGLTSSNRKVETRILAHARVPAYDDLLCNRIAAVNPLLVAGAGVTRTLAPRRERDGAEPRHQ